MNIPLFALSGAFIAISSGVMAFVMFTLGRTRLHVLWGIFCISVLVWGVGGYFIGVAESPDTAFLWWRITHVGVAFIPILFLHFVLFFLKQRRPIILTLLYILAFSFSVSALFSDLLIANMRLVFGQFYYDSPPGIIYPLFTVYFFALTIYSHVLLYRAYKKNSLETDALDRARIKYFFLGMLISFSGGSISFLPVYGIDIYPVLNFAVVIYPIIIGYAILKHNLFDIRAATAQGLMFLLWIFVGVRLVLSTTREDLILNGLLFLAVVILGIFLVKSISKELRQRELIEKQEHELEAANKRQENLLHFMSHEVKGYLTKAGSVFAMVAEGDYGQITPELKNLLGIALADNRKGVTTIMDILSAGNLKKGTVSFTLKPFDFRAALQGVVDELKPAADEKDIKLSVSVGEGEYTITGDSDNLMKHVVRNLIDNAIKYTPQGAVTISLSHLHGTVRLAVKDSGVGITAEDKKHLFTEGGRGKDSLKVNTHSTGYGLFIAKQIVETHKGKIWAESAGAGKGSTFFVELPTNLPATPPLPPAENAATPAQAAETKQG